MLDFGREDWITEDRYRTRRHIALIATGAMILGAATAMLLFG